MNFKEWNEATNEWFKEKGIYEKGNLLAQFEKLQEEVGELGESLTAKTKGIQHFTDSRGRIQNTEDATIDSLGDCMVVIKGICEMAKVDMLDCMNHAYNCIKDRKGKMKCLKM